MISRARNTSLFHNKPNRFGLSRRSEIIFDVQKFVDVNLLGKFINQGQKYSFLRFDLN